MNESLSYFQGYVWVMGVKTAVPVGLKRTSGCSWRREDSDEGAVVDPYNQHLEFQIWQFCLFCSLLFISWRKDQFLSDSSAIIWLQPKHELQVAELTDILVHYKMFQKLTSHIFCFFNRVYKLKCLWKHTWDPTRNNATARTVIILSEWGFNIQYVCQRPGSP